MKTNVKKSFREIGGFANEITKTFVENRITSMPFVIIGQSVLEVLVRKETHPLRNASKYMKDTAVVTGILTIITVVCKAIGGDEE